MDRLLFRTDASPTIGLGHLTRSISLAKMLQDHWEIIFCCKELPDFSEKYIFSSGFDLIRLENDDEFFSLLNVSSIVILDGYHFGLPYQEKVKATNAILVCIDDVHDNEFFADLIINHAPYISPGDYKCPAHTLFALGLSYVLLRPLFIKALSKKPRNIKKVETVLVCIGGADPLNITQDAVSVASAKKEIRKIIVITGPSYVHSQTLTTLLDNDERIVHRKELDESEMFNCMCEADLAIVPSSGTLFETLAAGTPALIGKYTENQKIIYNWFIGKKNIFDCQDFSKNAIEQALIIAMEQEGLSSVNDFCNVAKGVKERYHKLFTLLKEMNRLFIRPATISDYTATYNWSTNPEIRKRSFSTRPITNEEHSAWFALRLEDKSCFYYIGEYEGKPAGSIRFDKREDVLRISYLVDPVFQGRGLGILFLSKGIKAVRTVCLSLKIKKIIGEVLPENIPSVKAFERLGFEAKVSEDRIVFEKNVL